MVENNNKIVENENIVEDGMKKLELNQLAQDPRVKTLIRQIFEKIARQKKYKKDSQEMLLELKQNLITLLNEMKNKKEMEGGDNNETQDNTNKQSDNTNNENTENDINNQVEE